MEINIALPNLAGRRCVHPRVQHCCDNHLDQHLPEYCQLREFLASFEQRAHHNAPMEVPNMEINIVLPNLAGSWRWRVH